MSKDEIFLVLFLYSLIILIGSSRAFISTFMKECSGSFADLPSRRTIAAQPTPKGHFQPHETKKGVLS